MEIKNAKIRRAILGMEHGFLTAEIHLDYGGSGQVFGQQCLYNPNRKDDGDRTGEWIHKVFKTLDVEKWHDLEGLSVRVSIERGLAVKIGHFLEDKWFKPRDLWEVCDE